VDATIPLNVVTSINQSIFSELREDEDVEFAIAHLKAPELDMRNAVEVDEDERGMLMKEGVGEKMFGEGEE